MDLYEYQARQMFKEHGVPVLDYRLASTPEEAREGARELLADGASLLVVKAQVKTGGRGKAGGVKLAHTADEAYEKAEAILGLDIKGHIVKKVMIASGADIAAEYYFSILLDRSNRRHLAMCSREGGMDIETLAKERPEALARVPLDPTVGIDAAISRRKPASTRRRPRPSPPSLKPCGPSTATRMRPWLRSTRWSPAPTAPCGRSTAR